MTIDLKIFAEWAAAILSISVFIGSILKLLESKLEKRLLELIQSIEINMDKKINLALKAHDENEHCHINHSNNAIFKAFVEERRHALEQVAERLAKQDIVLARIESRQENLYKAFEHLQEVHEESVKNGICFYKQLEALKKQS